jgi:hypothetical protein
MTIDDIFAELFETPLPRGYTLEKITLESPHQRRRAYGDPKEQLWTAEIRFSDGQYGGGARVDGGQTASEAIQRCMAGIKAALSG